MPKAAISYTTGASRPTPAPVIILIDTFRAADVAYIEQTRGLAPDGDYDAIADATYAEPWHALAEAPAATTREGAIAALDVVLNNGDMIAGEQGEALIRSARAYLAALPATSGGEV